MIQAATSPAQRAEFCRRVAHRAYFGPTMGTHMALYGQTPASGWGFYLLPGSAALALRGGTATLCGGVGGAGESTPQARAQFWADYWRQNGEELTGFLRFVGVDRLVTDAPPPPGWQARPLLLWQLPQGRQLPLPPQPGGYTLDAAPRMGPVSRLVFAQSPGEAEEFYSAACTAINHGYGVCHALCQNGAPVCTVGSYERSETEAYMSAGVTHPAHRGRGLAAWLIPHLANELARQYTVTFTSVPELERYYTKLQFIQIGILNDCKPLPI